MYKRARATPWTMSGIAQDFSGSQSQNILGSEAFKISDIYRFRSIIIQLIRYFEDGI